jgi:nucleotide-binding universal stress UspA family protein
MSEGPILICYDGSEDSKQAVARAGELFPSGEAIVLHVWEPLKEAASVPPVPGLTGMLDAGLQEMDAIGEDVAKQLAAAGADQAKACGLKAEPMSVRAPGRAWRNILRIAGERDACVVVVGQRGVSGAERVLLGSVSTAIVHHAETPVLVVPGPRA